MNTNSTPTPTPTSDIVVIGGGLAGLAAAALVAKQGHSVTVLEARGEPGGQARSSVHNGFTFNRGPHALYLGGAGERVLRSLDITLSGGKPATAGNLVFDGRPEIAPAGPATLLRTGALSVKGKVAVGKTLAKLPKLRPAEFARYTVDEWIADLTDDRRAGDMLRALTRLACYTNQPDQLSADVMITQMQLALGPGVLYLDHGWQSLVDQLAAVPGVELRTGVSVTELPDARAIIIATGGPTVAAKLTGRTYDVGPEAAASCLDLGLQRAPDSDFVLGGDEPFYFSNHSRSADLAPHGQHHAAAVQYLADGDDPDPDAIMAFTAHAGVRPDDIVESRRLHRMVTVAAIPTAARGGMQGRPAVTDTGHDHVFLAGDWVGSDGHLTDAVLASAEAAAAAAVRSLESSLVG